MPDKIVTAAVAMAPIQNGAHVAAHYWGLSGTPGYLIRALVASGVKDLTVYFNNFLPVSEVLRNIGVPDPTILLPQIRKIVTGFLGTRVFASTGGDFLGDLVEKGIIEVEMTAHGVLAERLHAGSMKLGGFYSPIGVNTTIDRGKERKMIDGVEYLFEKAIQPDVGLIKADRADTMGNLVYRGTGRGLNPVIAMAAKYTIAEVYDIVEPGVLDPEVIVTPGIYIDRIVKIPDDDIASEKRQPELLQKIKFLAALKAAATSPGTGGAP